MNDKPRVGRPPNQDGHLYRTIGVSGTPSELAAVLDTLSPRERMEAMLDKIAAQCAAELMATIRGYGVDDGIQDQDTYSHGHKTGLVSR